MKKQKRISKRQRTAFKQKLARKVRARKKLEASGETRFLLLARAFNEWMRRYTDEPERFEREFNTVADFRYYRARELEPEYGRVCAQYLLQLVDDVKQ